MLAEDQTDVCTRFGSSTGRKFAGLEWHRSEWDTPSFADALVRVHCDVEAVHVAGDHDVVIGRVLAPESPAEEIRPMLFYRGRFGVDDPNAPVLDGWGWGNRWGEQRDTPSATKHLFGTLPQQSGGVRDVRS